MSTRINTILPIVLAITLSGLGLYTHSRTLFPENIGFFVFWFIVSLFLYLLWQLLWLLSDKQSRNKKRRSIIGLSIVLIVFLAVSFAFVTKNQEDLELDFLIRLILVLVLILGFQYGLKAQQNISNLQIEKEQLQTENYKAQLKALRAKIDPHFLFNSLNTLRSMVRHQHPNSENFIMSLSDFYRQTLKYDENSTLELSEELNVLKSYLFLMKNRNEEAVSVNIDIDSGLFQHRLPTMALQVVAENCFKHNSMTSKMPLNIEVSQTPDKYIRVRNNIQPKIGEEKASGFGLDLLRKRYKLMNVERGVVIEETPNDFSVKLKLIEA